MAYDVTLVQVNANIGGWHLVNTAMGFPTTSFDTILFSMWSCLPGTGPLASSNGGPAYGTYFFWINAKEDTTLQLGRMDTPLQFFFATYDTPGVRNVRSHHLISVNCATQTVQYYLNDQEVPIISGGWTSTGSFRSRTSINDWRLDIGSSFGLVYPAFGDLWMAATPTFVDLGVASNRRKFTNGDVTPIDLGPTGTVPFGYQPQIYQTVRPGGVANDMLINRGSGTGPFVMDDPYTLSLQAPGVCNLLPPLPGPSCAAIWTRDTVPPFERVF